MLSDNVILPNGLDLTSMLKLMNAKVDEVDTFSGFAYARFQSTHTISEAMDSPLRPFKPSIFSSRGDIPYDPDTGLFTAAPGQMYIFITQFVMNSASTSWARIRHFITQTYNDGVSWSDYSPSIRNLEISPPLTTSGSTYTPTLANTRHAFPVSLQILSYATSNVDASNGLVKFGQGMQLETTKAYPLELGFYGILLHYNTWES